VSTDPGTPAPPAVLLAPSTVRATVPRPPGTVLAAVTVTWACTGVTVVASLALYLFGLWMGDLLAPAFDFEVDPRVYLSMVEAGVLLWSTVASVLALGVVRRRRGARVGLAISSAATLVLSVVLAATIASVGTLVCALAVVVLLFVPSSNAWFRQEGSS
jgi:hypothetical protein